eukprot:205206-Pelagomonas_calceolata.AAC.7
MTLSDSPSAAVTGGPVSSSVIAHMPTPRPPTVDAAVEQQRQQGVQQEQAPEDAGEAGVHDQTSMSCRDRTGAGDANGDKEQAMQAIASCRGGKRARREQACAAEIKWAGIHTVQAFIRCRHSYGAGIHM